MKQQQLEKENAQLKSQIETQAASIKLLQEELKLWAESEKAWRNGRYVSEYCRMEQEIESLKQEKQTATNTANLNHERYLDELKRSAKLEEANSGLYTQIHLLESKVQGLQSVLINPSSVEIELLEKQKEIDQIKSENLGLVLDKELLTRKLKNAYSQTETNKDKEIDKLKAQIESAKDFWKDEVVFFNEKLHDLSKENRELKHKNLLLITGVEPEAFQRGYQQAQADFKYMQSSGKKWWRIFK